MMTRAGRISTLVAAYLPGGVTCCVAGDHAGVMPVRSVHRFQAGASMSAIQMSIINREEWNKAGDFLFIPN